MFRIIGIVMSYWPVIIAIIRAIEALVSPSTPGEEKKALALAAVQRFLAKLPSPFTVNLTPQMMEHLSKVIDGLVAVLNVIGLFKPTAEVTPEQLEELEAAAPVSAAAAHEAVLNRVMNDPVLDEFLDKLHVRQ